jgi:hypothetical protein
VPVLENLSGDETQSRFEIRDCAGIHEMGSHGPGRGGLKLEGDRDARGSGTLRGAASPVDHFLIPSQNASRLGRKGPNVLKLELELVVVG